MFLFRVYKKLALHKSKAYASKFSLSTFILNRRPFDYYTSITPLKCLKTSTVAGVHVYLFGITFLVSKRFENERGYYDNEVPGIRLCAM